MSYRSFVDSLPVVEKKALEVMKIEETDIIVLEHKPLTLNVQHIYHLYILSGDKLTHNVNSLTNGEFKRLFDDKYSYEDYTTPNMVRNTLYGIKVEAEYKFSTDLEIVKKIFPDDYDKIKRNKIVKSANKS